MSDEVRKRVTTEHVVYSKAFGYYWVKLNENTPVRIMQNGYI